MIRPMIVWTLKRGIVDPPEPLDPENAAHLVWDDINTREERDAPLTQEQQWMEEGRRCGYIPKKPPRRERMGVDAQGHLVRVQL